MARKRINMDRIRKTTESIGRTLRDTSNAGAGELVSLSLDRIDLNPDNPRKLNIDPDFVSRFLDSCSARPSDPDFIESAYDALEKLDSAPRAEMEGLIGLADSIHNQGLIQPVVVVTAPRARYTLIAGERRYLAHCLLAKDTIRAIIRPLDDYGRCLLALSENLNRENLSLAETVDGIEALVDIWQKGNPGKKLSGSTLARLIHRSPQQSRRFLQILKAESGVREKIRKREVTSLRQALALVSGHEHEDEPKTRSPAGPGDDDPPASRAENVSSEDPGDRSATIRLGSTSSLQVVRAIIERSTPANDSFPGLADVNWTSPKDVQRAWDRFLSAIASEVEN